MTHESLVIKLAVLSRLLIVLLQIASNYLIPNHDANVFISPQTHTNESACASAANVLVDGFRRWDAEYFLHIAEHGYTYENTLVFYPLFPFCVRYLTNLTQLIFNLNCEFHDLSLFVAVVLNIVFFTKAALVLYQLTVETFNSHRLARIVVPLFCFNPASIFFSAPYSESLFCWLSFSVMLHCSRGHFSVAAIPLVVGMWCRSNGLLNFGFVIYYVTRDMWKSGNTTIADIFKGLFKVVSCAIFAGLAFTVVQMYYLTLYCEDNPFEMHDVVRDYGVKRDLLLAGQRKAEWCTFSVPFSYSYLQSHYWNVGFMRYYEFKQLPNFILAAPILTAIIYHTVQFIIGNPNISMQLGLMKSKTKNSVEKSNQFVYVVHALALSIFCIFYVHIQVSTRMIASSSPYIYWIYGRYLLDEQHPNPSKAFLQPKTRITKCFKAWFLGYFVIGTFLFSNFLPWT